jgi:dTDP-4-dehydrorhamnose 3,5-epimerase
MIFTSTRLSGVFEICIEPIYDERGFFARSWCRREFEQHDLLDLTTQSSMSFNQKKGTLRGMHFQALPHPEAKLVRCARGAIFDVALDLRPESSTFKNWIGVELSAQKRNALYVPPGCAHGFLTLENDTEVFYQMSEFFVPELSRGVRWDDPAFKIDWPSQPAVMSDRDRTYPDFA